MLPDHGDDCRSQVQPTHHRNESLFDDKLDAASNFRDSHILDLLLCFIGLYVDGLFLTGDAAKFNIRLLDGGQLLSLPLGDVLAEDTVDLHGCQQRLGGRDREQTKATEIDQVHIHRWNNIYVRIE